MSKWNDFWNNWLYSAGEVLVAALLALAIGIVNGLQIGRAIATESLQEKAKAAGVAKWTIDPKTGVREFRFIGPNTKETGK